MKVRQLQGDGDLRVRITEIPREGFRREVVLPPAWLGPRLTDRYEAPAEPGQLVFELRRLGENVEATGTLGARAPFVCSRCSDDVTLDVAAEWHALFVPRGSTRVDLTGDEAGASVSEGLQVVEMTRGVVDLEGPVTEALVLALAAYPRCSPDCLGVCAGCGENLNRGACRCGVAAQEPSDASAR